MGDLGGAADAVGPSRTAVPVSPPAISRGRAVHCQIILVPLPQSHLDLLAGLKACEEAVLERIMQLLPHISYGGLSQPQQQTMSQHQVPPQQSYESLQPHEATVDVPSDQVRE